MPVHEVMRPAREIGYGGLINVNPNVVVKRREDLLEMQRPVVGFAAQAVGRTNHLSGLHAREASSTGNWKQWCLRDLLGCWVRQAAIECGQLHSVSTCQISQVQGRFGIFQSHRAIADSQCSVVFPDEASGARLCWLHGGKRYLFSLLFVR